MAVFALDDMSYLDSFLSEVEDGVYLYFVNFWHAHAAIAFGIPHVAIPRYELTN